MTIDRIREIIMPAIQEYPICKVTLFGSRATGTYREDSDIDLIVEFSAPTSLLTISSLKYRLEELLGKEVDVIHGPIRETDMIEVGKTVEIYAA